MSLNPNRPLTGYRLVRILQGDTLQRIAARELGDASQWVNLVTINKLSYPYVTADDAHASPTVKLYGDSLAVPSTRSVASLLATSSTGALGTDIALNLQGMLFDDGMGDFAVVSGDDNYTQAAKNAIATGPKELLWHLRYGCKVRQLIGSMNGPAAGILAENYVRGTLLADRRTVSVPAVSVVVDADAIHVSATAVTINGTTLTILQDL